MFYNLHLHPQILLHRMKETYFFNMVGKPGHPHHTFDTLEDYLASFHEPFGERLKKHYTSLRKSLALYRPKVIGEATASYAVLPGEMIAAIVAYKPDIKGIIMLRDPVERAWSHAKKTLVRGKSGPVGFEQFRAYFETDGQRQRADYPTMIEAWRRHLRPGHLYLGRYDRIATEPRPFLEDIERFLGVTTRALFFNRHLTIKLNPTSSERMPDDIRAFLEEFLARDADAYRRLIAEVGSGKAV